MSDVNFKGAFKRALKGDIDPINLFSLNPTEQEMKDNQAEMARRAAQIEFEKNNMALKAAGGSVDPATKQIAKLRNRTTFSALSPLAPPGGLARAIGVAHQVRIDKKHESERKSRLRKKNEEHAASQGKAIRSLGILGARRGG